MHAGQRNLERGRNLSAGLSRLYELAYFAAGRVRDHRASATGLARFRRGGGLRLVRFATTAFAPGCTYRSNEGVDFGKPVLSGEGGKRGVTFRGDAGLERGEFRARGGQFFQAIVHCHTQQCIGAVGVLSSTVATDIARNGYRSI